ncbi:hypothetical protein MATL_G00022940 [Megalops atlanticus]|uniref:Beta-galactoside alpha-2,6-sialyltransferase 1 n=1 Tax=Megalops atlanticus TaxID=7932 RepID=A0A9D3QCM9_MEGAT|nr:hypothetical protein MATL_G00022940 [Megalops atlanticus]
MEFRKKLHLAFSIATAMCLFLCAYHSAILTPSPPWMWRGCSGATEVPEEESFGAAPPAPRAANGRQRWSVWNEFSTSISKEVLQSLKVQWATNRFRVPRNLTRRNATLGREELLCELKTRVPLGTIRAGDGPFLGSKWKKVLPAETLAEKLGPFKTCAVVMSSGSIRNSTLGVEIDSHDAILRLNTAPTDGYSVDVGNRTTIRIINTQVMMSAAFLTDPLYSTGALIVRHPVPYSRDPYALYKKRNYDFLQRYREYRRLRPQQPFYILSASFQWNLWDVIQENSPMDIQPNPPSSGMLGVAVMMNICEQVSVYEFLPSHRKTRLCHYFQNVYNWQCTAGHYHPVTFEKNLVKRLNRGSEFDIYARGKVMLRGFSQQWCPKKL